METQPTDAVFKHLPPWLEMRSGTLYCIPGDFFLDPARPCARAVITHGHGDHARGGHTDVLATPETLAIMRLRFKEQAGERQRPLAYHESIDLGGVRLRFIPAGHILGSAQAVLEYQNCRVIVSGDYKRRPDPTCPPFEVMGCDIFITEATFGLPVFTHPPALGEAQSLVDSLAREGRTHLVGVYALGKCQRLICLLREAGYDAPIYLHGALVAMTELYRAHGVAMGDTRPVAGVAKEDLAGQLVLCTPSEVSERWSRRFGDPIRGVASGWMAIRQRAKQKGVELPLIISDHADWPELLQTLSEVDPHLLLVTHGQEEALVHQAQVMGYQAAALHIAAWDEEEMQ